MKLSIYFLCICFFPILTVEGGWHKLGCTTPGGNALICGTISFRSPPPTTPSPTTTRIEPPRYLRANLPTPPPNTDPPPALCMEESEKLLEATDASYNDKDATKTVHQTDDDGRTIEYFDFTTASLNAIYKTACEYEPNGNYVELTYKMSCASAKDEEVDIFVTKHPRCFSSTCTTADQDALLKQFVVKPTEDRNSKEGSTWSCTGAVIITTDDIPSTLVDKQTDELNNEEDSIVVAKSSLADQAEETFLQVYGLVVAGIGGGTVLLLVAAYCVWKHPCILLL